MSERVQKPIVAYIEIMMDNFQQIDAILDNIMKIGRKPQDEPTEEEFDELMYLEKLQMDLGTEILSLYDSEDILVALKGNKYEKDILDVLFVPVMGLDSIN